ncbi:MAG: hypothetical protein Q9P90_04665 [candidate division KSB1 bacterium]|nr:hypothetical protein [candidate division KSB1 bacterium]
MRYLIYALLLATLIALAVKLASGEVRVPIRNPNLKPGNELSAQYVDQPSAIWKELGNLLLVSFSFILAPVLAGYYLFRLTLTVHRFLFTIVAIIVLVDIVLIFTGVFQVTIRYDRILELLVMLKDVFAEMGVLRSVVFVIGAIFGIRGYWADLEN